MKEEEKINFNLYYFVTFLKLTNLWSDFLKEKNIFHREEKMTFNNSVNGLKNMEALINKYLPEKFKEEMEEMSFVINDFFDKLLKEKDLKKRENIIFLLKKIAKDEIEFK